MRNHPGIALIGWLAAAVMAVSGVLISGVNMGSIPLVGGQVSGPSYRLHLLFTNALNLPDRAPVRLNGAVVGNVEHISTRGYVAVVDVRIRSDIKLPVGTTAQLRRSTPLGDVSIALVKPDSRRGSLLADGDTLGVAQTLTTPQIEDLITSSSLLISGGNLTDIITIVHDVQLLLKGREGVPAALMGRLETLLAVAHNRSEQIDQILADSDAIASDLNKNRVTLRETLKQSPAAAAALAKQTDEFVNLTDRLGELGAESHDLIVSGSRDLVPLLTDTTTVLRGFESIDGELAPVLTDLIGLVPILRAVTRGEQLSGTANFTVQPSIINGLPSNDEILPGLKASSKGATATPPPEKPKATSAAPAPQVSDLLAPVQKLLGDLLGGKR